MFGRRKRDSKDFSEELQAHLALEADELRSEGLDEKDARARAHREFGNTIQSQERFYEASRWVWLEQLRKDIGLALRQLARNKSFTTVAVLTLALGIGANTAVFTLVNAVMLQPLPVPNPGELYRIGDTDECCVISGSQGRFSIFAYPLYKYLREHTPAFQELAAFKAHPGPYSVVRVGGSGMSEPFQGQFVSGNYFTMFGVQASAGRIMQATDDAPGASPIAVLSQRAWQERFALDPAVIGSSFLINGIAFTIAGVAPPGFFGDTLLPDPPELWMPLSSEPLIRGQNSLLNDPRQHWLYIIGRLKHGESTAKLQAGLNVLLKQWLLEQAGTKSSERDRDRIAKEYVGVVSARSGIQSMKSQYNDGLKLMGIISGLVLLIACANLANLLLARRTAGRLQDSIRIALGAPRQRLIRQTLIESVLLALAAGAAGLFVAFAGTRAILLIAFRGSGFVPIQAAPSSTVLMFALLLSLLTGILFGVVPAWISGRTEPGDVLRGANRSTGNHSTLPQRSLVVLQAALSLVLLTFAGILSTSLRNLEHQTFGFETSGRMMVSVSPTFAGYSPDRIYGVYQQLEQRVSQIPGVRSASFALYSPMQGDNWSSTVHFEGRPLGENDGSSWDRVSAHYFETIGTRLIRGRLIDERDTPNSRFVAVVNQTFVRKFFPNGDPIGKHFGLSGAGDYEIVGIVDDAKYHDARDNPWPTFFLPLLQMSREHWTSSALARSNNIASIQLRIAGKTKSLEATLRRTIADIDPNLTVLKVRAFADQLGANFNQERLLARLTSLFGILALLVASVGLYGITAYAVIRRTSEIGVRIALGASRTRVVRMVLRSAALQTGLGLGIGIPVALWGSRFLASQLYGVTPNDPTMLAGAAVVLGACGVAAGIIPALRAAGIDPIRALRTE